MKKALYLIISIWLAAAMLVGTLPAAAAGTQPTLAHTFDDAALLLISNRVLVDGDTATVSTSVRNAALAAQASSTNEIDFLIQLYGDQLALARQQNLGSAVENALILELETKISVLEGKSRQLAAARQARRRPGGLRGFVKGLGRLVGRVVGGAMEGAGKVAEFAIEEVSPRVIKEVVMAGNPVTGAAIRSVLRKMLRERLEQAITRQLEKRRERIEVVQDTSAGDELIDSMETKSVIEQTQAAQNQPPQTNPLPAGDDIKVYEFTLEDNIYNQGENGSIGWSVMGEDSGYHCYNTGIYVDQAVVHLEFDTAAMTVSGWVEGSADGSGIYHYKEAYGAFRVSFSGIPLVVEQDASTGVAYVFSGEGQSTASFSGVITCRYWDDVNKNDVYEDLSRQTSIEETVTVTGKLYRPGERISLFFGTGNRKELFPDDLTFGIGFEFTNPIDIPMP